MIPFPIDKLDEFPREWDNQWKNSENAKFTIGWVWVTEGNFYDNCP
jgi:hypothetical protein